MQLSTVHRTHSQTRIALGVILLLFAAMSAVGITWGLPSRNIDKYLFGDGEVWSGEKIYRLAKADAKFSPTRGADVDVDPIRKGGDEPIPLTAADEDVAKIYLRYRLYTYQPDEMITMMALAGMRPSKLDFDPRLYQYGGLFIYPVGALIKLCGLLGLIDVRSDVVYYLDNPDEFGKFYIVARAYSAAWGLIGVIVVYAIASRIALIRTPSAGAGSWPVACAPGSDRSHRAGLLAALLFTLMPVVVCMAHEGKPHLPGAVLMLLAVYFAMRCLQSETAKIEDRSSKVEDELGCHPERSEGSPSGVEMLRYAQHDPKGIGIRHSTFDTRHSFWWMCLCCGAALGMVLSSWPIFVLIPLVAFRAAGFSPRDRAIRMLIGTAVAIGVYLITNPYILINAFANREVLISNFGNSLAMYEIARLGEGFVRTVELTVQGATLPVLLLGLVGLALIVVRKQMVSIPLIGVAAIFFLQFVLIGAGKPAEYGRFGIFTNTTLAIGAAYVFVSRWPNDHPVTRGLWCAFLSVWVALLGAMYMYNFAADASPYASRLKAVPQLQRWVQSVHHAERRPTIAVTAEPAPYCCPPLAFSSIEVVMVTSSDRVQKELGATWRILEQKPSWVDPKIGAVLRQLWEVKPERRYEYSPQTPISWANKPFSLEIP